MFAASLPRLYLSYEKSAVNVFNRYLVQAIQLPVKHLLNIFTTNGLPHKDIASFLSAAKLLS